MMRKDVRIGLGIGGVVLAVVIVFMLVTSAPPQNSEVTLAPDPAPANTNGAAPDETTTAPPQTDVPLAPGESVESDPFRNAPPTTDPAKPADDREKPQTDDPWHRALHTGTTGSDTPPLLLTETPSAAPAANPPAPTDTPAPAPPDAAPAATDGGAVAMNTGASVLPSIPPPTGSDHSAAGITPTTQPRSAQRTHVVQRGESFATIAAAAYGSDAYYPHLMRANPKIDPKKLRPGMTIIIPDESEVVAKVPTDAAGSSAAPAVPGRSIDEKLEYRVQLNDSLYKISLRLYGRADKVDAIYELNKDAIGPNRSHLKVGTILKLPEPPTSATAGR